MFMSYCMVTEYEHVNHSKCYLAGYFHGQECGKYCISDRIPTVVITQDAELISNLCYI